MEGQESELVRIRVAEILEFARENLGPRSEAVLANPAVQTLLLSRLRAGVDLPDAVLAEVHARGRDDREMADEFLGYFLRDAYRGGQRFVSPILRRFVDTGDLMHSAFGDLWQEFSDLKFERRAQFLALIAMRLRWKAQDQVRRMTAARRAEDQRVEMDSGVAEPVDLQPSPASAALANEDRERLALAILRLPDRDRLLVRLHLRGEPISEIMNQCGLSHEATRKALQRALVRARAVAR